MKDVLICKRFKNIATDFENTEIQEYQMNCYVILWKKVAEEHVCIIHFSRRTRGIYEIFNQIFQVNRLVFLMY